MKWPDFATQLRYMKMIAENGFIKLDTGLTARRPGCFVDGAVWPVEKGTNKEVERMNWCSKHHITGVNNVFAFGPDAEIIWEIVNAPGSWNDTDLCRGLTVVLNDVTMTLPEFCALADVAFKGEGCETAYLTLASAAVMSLTKKAGDVAALTEAELAVLPGPVDSAHFPWRQRLCDEAPDELLGSESLLAGRLAIGGSGQRPRVERDRECSQLMRAFRDRDCDLRFHF